MYSFASASQRLAPTPRTIIGGSPPTARKARTGESTPPGMTRSARCCNLREISSLRGMRAILARLFLLRDLQRVEHGAGFLVAQTAVHHATHDLTDDIGDGARLIEVRDLKRSSRAGLARIEVVVTTGFAAHGGRAALD